jgi:hypothetical protein
MTWACRAGWLGIGIAAFRFGGALVWHALH